MLIFALRKQNFSNKMKVVLFSLFTILNVVVFAQRDTLDYSMRLWSVDDYQNKTELELDTFLHGFQVYNPIYKTDISHAFSGNAAQAYQNTYFLNREEQPFLFFTPYADYLFTPDNVTFFNTKQAYSQFQYFSNLAKKNNMQNVDFLHTQNVLHNLNLGFQYRLIGAEGEYKAQKSSNHFFRAFGSFEHKNYEAFLVYNYNKFNSYLNGGIESDTLLDNPNNLTDDTKLLPVRLSDSQNAILGRNINLKQNFIINKRIPNNKRDSLLADSLQFEPEFHYIPQFQIGHELDWNYNNRIYSNAGSPGFYQQFFIDSAAVTTGAFATDSTGYSSFNNTFFIRLLDDSLNTNLSSVSVAYTNSQESFHSYQNSQNAMHHIAKFQISNPVYDTWYWEFNADYNFLGGDKGDFDINGKVQKFFGSDKQQNIRFEPGLSHTSPNTFAQSFSSNFHKWENDFTEKYALTTFDFAYTNEKLKLELGVKQAYLDNYVYFASKQDSVWRSDTIPTTFEWIHGYPDQRTSTFGILSFYLNHRLDIGAFHMLNSLTYQKVSNDTVLHLPQLTYYNSTYFQMRFFKKVLTMQIGFDLRYNSAYYADAFMPSTGMFYNQSDKLLGDYPYVDFFINMKIKRARLFLKYEHVNKGFSGNQYYTVVGQPMNPRVFRFGLSWRFWN